MPTLSSRRPSPARLGRTPIRGLRVLLAAFCLTVPALMTHEPAAGQEVECIDPPYQIHDKPTCLWPKDIISACSELNKQSIFAQCNVFDLAIGKDQERVDDLNGKYLSAIFKYSERNACSTGDNDAFSILGKCDIFAAYAQIFRSLDSGKCYALVNTALLGTQLKEDSKRNDPNKFIQKVEIPGISRRIIFTPSKNSPLLKMGSARLIRTSESATNYLRAGHSVSALHLLELESTLTIKPDNLKPNPAKMRLTRGVGTNTDILDIPLSKGNEEALNRILKACA